MMYSNLGLSFRWTLPLKVKTSEQDMEIVDYLKKFAKFHMFLL